LATVSVPRLLPASENFSMVRLPAVPRLVADAFADMPKRDKRPAPNKAPRAPPARSTVRRLVGLSKGFIWIHSPCSWVLLGMTGTGVSRGSPRRLQIRQI